MNETSKLAASALTLEREVRAAAFGIIEQSGDYQKARDLLQIAEDVGLVAQRLGATTERAVARVLPGPASPKRTRSSGSGTGSRSRYPQFFIEAGRLVKIGKGKQKSAKPYRHEATRETFDAVVAWISHKVDSGRVPFRAADANDDLNTDYASYQIYLVITALREIGVLSSGSRGHYAVDGGVSASSAQWWTALERLPRPEQEV